MVEAETRHAELMARRERRRRELEQQRSLSLQALERFASVLVLPHPEREAPEVRRLQSDVETEAKAMRVAMDYERPQGRQVYDVHEKTFGYDLTSLDANSGELRLIEMKGIGAPTGIVVLTLKERHVAKYHRDRNWLYLVTHCDIAPTLQPPVKVPVRFDWKEVTKVAYHYLSVTALMAQSPTEAQS